MKAVMVMFDSLNRNYLPNFGNDLTKMPNFKRLAKKTLTFNNFYGGSMPCMPARRELHTGRYNFLHRSWTPLEPFDDSIIERMKNNDIYTHIVTDHFHYWEDGGATYLNRYNSYEMIRGQQGDHWIGQVKDPEYPETASKRSNTINWRHDWVNRQYLDTEEKLPQTITFRQGIEFIDHNIEEDNWFLQIESFDPHEPFYSLDKHKKLYPREYEGKQLDWPDYGKNSYTTDETEHVKLEYAALMSMCDDNLGKILDKFDEYNMWEDTLLIVNTDHGFMLGEKEWMGKNVQPFYNEIIHIPFFIYDPRTPTVQNEFRESLAQTIDIVPTLADFFNIQAPNYMDGKSLKPIIESDKKIREVGLFGIHGGHVNVTDGRYVYMHASIDEENQPLNEYTLMPNHMNSQFKKEELKETELVDDFDFMEGVKVLKIPTNAIFNPFWYGNKLFDLKEDPKQLNELDDLDIQLRMIYLMRELMIENECPLEQFKRLGIPREDRITEEIIDEMNYYKKPFTKEEYSRINKRTAKVISMGLSITKESNHSDILSEIKQYINNNKKITDDLIIQLCTKDNKEMKDRLNKLINFYI